MDEDEYDSTRPAPIEAPGLLALEGEDCDWVEAIGLNSLQYRANEGAIFTRIDENVFIIAVRGAQPLHHDRHLDDMEDAKGFSQDTWNFVASPSEGQFLLLEIDEQVYETFALDGPTMIYFNTYNRHALSRKSANDNVVLLQADGFGPDQMCEAMTAMQAAVAKRQNLGRI